MYDMMKQKMREFMGDEREKKIKKLFPLNFGMLQCRVNDVCGPLYFDRSLFAFSGAEKNLTKINQCVEIEI